MSTEKKDFPQVEPQVSNEQPAKADNNPKQPSNDKHYHKIVDKLGELASSLANRLKVLEANVKQNQGDQIAGFEKLFALEEKQAGVNKALDNNIGRLSNKLQGLYDSTEGLDPKIADLQKQLRALGDIVNAKSETLAKALNLAETANNRLDALGEDERLGYPALLHPAAKTRLSDVAMTYGEAIAWAEKNRKYDIEKAVFFTEIS